MNEAIANIAAIVPWGCLLLVFSGMLGLCFRLVGALDDALSRKDADAPTKALLPTLAGLVRSPAAPPPGTPQAPSKPPVVVPSGTGALAAIVVDPGLVAFIKKAEAFSPKAFWDYKQYSIGYGTKANSPTEVIDEAEATRRLIVEINNAEKLAEAIIPVGAPIGVKQALTDLTYNAGSGWREQSLGTLIKEGKYEEAKSHILAYNHAGGVVNAGLTARREAEVKWFETPL